MSLVRRRDTAPELRLRSELWRRNVRGWRCDVAALPGRPDLAFTRWRVAVFVDGRLWHGHPSKYPAALSSEWRAKIAANIQRDRQADSALRQDGWQVLRFWDVDLQRDAAGCVTSIVSALGEAKHGPGIPYRG